MAVAVARKLNTDVEDSEALPEALTNVKYLGPLTKKVFVNPKALADLTSLRDIVVGNIETNNIDGKEKADDVWSVLILLSTSLNEWLRNIRNKTEEVILTTDFLMSLVDNLNILKSKVDSLSEENSSEFINEKIIKTGEFVLNNLEISKDRFEVFLGSSIVINQIIDNIKSHLEIVAIKKECKEQEQKKEEASINAVTSLPARIKFEQKITELIKEWVDFNLIYIDVNKLKAVNDTLGHLNGDKYLQASADVLRKNSRENDLIFHIGGDEMIILSINNGLTAEMLKKRAYFEFVVQKSDLNIEECLKSTSRGIKNAENSRDDREAGNIFIMKQIKEQLLDDSLTEIKVMGSMAVGMASTEEEKIFSKEFLMERAEADMERHKDSMKKIKNPVIVAKINKVTKSLIEGWTLDEIAFYINEIMDIYEKIIGEENEDLYKSEYKRVKRIIRGHLNTKEKTLKEFIGKGIKQLDDEYSETKKLLKKLD